MLEFVIDRMVVKMIKFMIFVVYGMLIWFNMVINGFLMMFVVLYGRIEIKINIVNIKKNSVF